VGRADGAPRPGETGRKAAAPLLLDLFDLVARIDPNAPLGQEQRRVDENMKIARIAAPRRKSAPEIVFPRNGVEIYSTGDDRGVVLAARGGAGGYAWYVGGGAVAMEATSGKAVWRPAASGFYDIVVVDSDGRSARAKVRVAVAG
ncbi:MAG: penicillin-binding protein 1C, partial [Parvularculaceae bacterium]